MSELNTTTLNDITGVILAGGRAKRMGGQDKGLLSVNGQMMIELIIDRLTPQVGEIFINANRNLEQYKKYNHPVISDNSLTDFHGPLAGMLSALKNCNNKYILTIPCDSPFFPLDLSNRLLSALIQADAEISVVHDGQRMQPVFALIKTELADSMQDFLDNGDRKIALFYQQHHTVLTDLSDFTDIGLNINTPEELEKLELKLSGHKQHANKI